MDIKNALNAILPINLRTSQKTEKAIKSDSTTDRDANGQQAGGQNEEHREPMTEEQIKKALDTLKNFPAVKDHQLSVELIEANGRRFVLLKEPNGKVVRRIPEIELWSLPQFTEGEQNQKGQLLRKTA